MCACTKGFAINYTKKKSISPQSLVWCLHLLLAFSIILNFNICKNMSDFKQKPTLFILQNILSKKPFYQFKKNR